MSELSQPNAADNISPHVRGSSQQISSSPRAEVGSASISLQKPNCITSTYRYFGEIQDDVPHGYGIRVYTNSGSVEKGEFFLGVFQRLGEFTCADYGTPSLPSTCSLFLTTLYSTPRFISRGNGSWSWYAAVGALPPKQGFTWHHCEQKVSNERLALF